MEPTNQKHLYHVLMATIEDVRSKNITCAQAGSISDLAARTNTAVKLEHDRVRLQMELERHKSMNPMSKVEMRNIEGKNFE